MLTETWVIYDRQIRSNIRNPVWVFFGLTQPILYLVLFGPLLTNVSGGGLGGDESWLIFVPGLLLQLTIFGAGFAGFGIIQELREGVVERQRVTPAHRSALILGRALSNTVTIGVQAVHLVMVAIPFGLRPSWWGVVVSVVMVSVLSLGAMTFGEADEKSFMHKIGCDEKTSFSIMSRAAERGADDVAKGHGRWLRHVSRRCRVAASASARKSAWSSGGRWSHQRTRASPGGRLATKRPIAS